MTPHVIEYVRAASPFLALLVDSNRHDARPELLVIHVVKNLTK
jgi:hypothetical protein